MSQKINKYEAIIILESGSAEDVVKAKGEIDSNLEKRQAAIEKKEDWGTKKLFNSDKHENGYFYYVSFATAPANVEQISKDLRVNQNILKSTIAKIA